MDETDLNLFYDELLAEMTHVLGGVLTNIPLYLFIRDESGVLREAVATYQAAVRLQKTLRYRKSPTQNPYSA